MADSKSKLQARAEGLHADEEHEQALAAKLPGGKARDEHKMKGERLSDEAWSLEEANDLEPTPSGLWPPTEG